MSKSEEIIQDWHDAKTLYHNKFRLGPQSMTMTEIVQALLDKIDDLKDELKEHEDSYRLGDRW